MKTQIKNTIVTDALNTGRLLKFKIFSLLLIFIFLLPSISVFAHCDSYDGPVIEDALKALDQNNVQLVLKWIEPQQEKEIITLFDKTYRLKNGDQQVYSIVEKYFFETLVRLHRETEGASYTGLKPAGSTTPFVVMADNSIAENDEEEVIKTVTTQLEQVLRERFDKVAKLSKTKDSSVEQGRAYVEAYVEYTHTLEGLEHLIQGPISHSK
ncbi:MAG: hypothetical protein HND52_12770 [Ignavibacteriae bacterium]|nr:hypothetical protein [Ignavibacteriota bacterium]NOG98824.1 hypothetical protein [Ignavibacteriota bacterium]